MASFDYAMITTATENIEIDDPANCCLLSEDQIKQNYLLVISTTLGITTMINYGPFIIDFDTLGDKVDYTLRRSQYDNRKICRCIENFLNYSGAVVKVEQITIDKAKEYIKNPIDYI